jgi:sugar phosphate isomerase/epimerase
MKLGVMAALFAGMDLDGVLDYCAELGLEAIELPAGGWPGKPFFEPGEVLASAARQREIRSRLADHGLALSALAVHGNPVHPDRARAAADHDAFATAVRLAPALGCDVVVTFSGCPAGAPGDRRPNWVSCAWPPDCQEILRYQWDEVLVPYWAEQARLCHEHGVKAAIEAHPGFCVYNPDTLARLAEAAARRAGLSGPGPIGANLDPSHLFWQGIDPVVAARWLGEAGLIHYVHAKDTELDRVEGPRNGYLDARDYRDLAHRSWTFRTCGYGHGDEFWKPFISTLRRAGYDGVLSIEHEDPLMSLREGLEKAAEYLGGIIIEEEAAAPWWVGDR